MPMLQRKQASRKFIDLFKIVTSRWMNWDPAVPIEAGDYGTVDIESGAFIREGNVYSVPEVADIAAKHPLEYGPLVDNYMLHSNNVKKLSGTPDYQVSKGEGGKQMLQGQWIFSSSRGAVALVHGAQVIRLSGEMQEDLKNTDWGNGKLLVTLVYRASAYAFYLSDKSRETISVNLSQDGPGSSSPADPSGKGHGPTWVASGVTGMFQHASASEPIFVPMYQIKEIKKRAGRRRQSPDPINDEEEEDLVVYDVPWSFLDEEGEEVPEFSDEDDPDF
ncbi:hypothetical protein ACEPAF_631 [Sanghuangporus sanghuang]